MRRLGFDLGEGIKCCVLTAHMRAQDSRAQTTRKKFRAWQRLAFFLWRAMTARRRQLQLRRPRLKSQKPRARSARSQFVKMADPQRLLRKQEQTSTCPELTDRSPRALYLPNVQGMSHLDLSGTASQRTRWIRWSDRSFRQGMSQPCTRKNTPASPNRRLRNQKARRLVSAEIAPIAIAIWKSVTPRAKIMCRPR